MVSPAQILVIGLDSADPNLLLNWCDSGDLPILQSLREKGVEGRLTSPAAMGDDAAWASFYTAVSPARHGRYYWRYLQSGSYITPQFRDEHLKHEPFWNVLSRAGRRVGIIDVPKCPLSRNLNGIQLADWLVHGRDHETCSWPPDLATTILARFGDDKTDRARVGSAEWLCRMDALSENELELFLRRTLDSIERKLAVSAQFLGHGDWDLFLTVFKESHCAGHQLWHLLDETHPEHNPSRARELGNPLKKVYQALDNAIGELLTLVGPETSVIVFSDLGMAPNYTGESFLDEILLRLENPLPSRCNALYRTGMRLAHKTRARLFGDRELHSHTHRRAFQVEHNEISGAIRVNLKGREPAGRIRPGKELEEFSTSLSRDLLDLINPDTGIPIVDQVLRTEALFDGEHRNCLPDLFVVWRRDAPITAVASPKLGELRLKTPHYRTGNHVADGIYFGYGPSVTADKQSCPASIMDLGPTIAVLLNTTLPDIDGKPIAALCVPRA
jgi:predicted AlkP superfamily phosphohydrolase/phosphomutase